MKGFIASAMEIPAGRAFRSCLMLPVTLPMLVLLLVGALVGFVLAPLVAGWHLGLEASSDFVANCREWVHGK